MTDKTAEAVPKRPPTDHVEFPDVVDIVSDEILRIFVPLIADHDLRSNILARAFAKDFAQNQYTGDPIDDICAAKTVVGDMVADEILERHPELFDDPRQPDCIQRGMLLRVRWIHGCSV